MTPDPTAVDTPLRKNHDFVWLMSGETVSTIGKGIANFAMPLVTLGVTESATQAGLVAAGGVGGSVLAMLPAGVVADRYHRKPLMLASAIASSALFLSLIAAGTWLQLTFLHLLFVSFLTGAAASLFGPAETSAMREVVPDAQLGSAQAVVEGRVSAARLLSGPLGGLLFSLGRVVPFAVNAAAYVAVVISTLKIRAPLRSATNRSTSTPRQDLREGLQWIWRRREIRGIVIVATLLNVALSGLMTTAIYHQIMIGTTPVALGLIETCLGAAGLAGAAVAPKLLNKVATGWLSICCVFYMLALSSSMIFSDRYEYVLVALSLSLAAGPVVNSAVLGYQMTVTPRAMQARVSTAVSFGAMCCIPLAPALAGWGLEHLSLALTMGLFIGIGAVALLVLFSDRSLRSIPKQREWALSEPMIEQNGPRAQNHARDHA